MESKIHKINENTANELIWTLEHNEIFTAGTSFKENEILAILSTSTTVLESKTHFIMHPSAEVFTSCTFHKYQNNFSKLKNPVFMKISF